MFKSISQFYQVVVILPPKNAIWEYLFNFLISNKYSIDGIYHTSSTNPNHLLINYNIIIEDFSMYYAKRILIFNSLEISSEE